MPGHTSVLYIVEGLLVRNRSSTFDSEEAEELKSTAEIIWGKLTLPSGSKLYIGSMYHPHA
jgi:hypothetical protein